MSPRVRFVGEEIYLVEDDGTETFQGYMDDYPLLDFEQIATEIIDEHHENKLHRRVMDRLDAALAKVEAIQDVKEMRVGEATLDASKVWGLVQNEPTWQKYSDKIVIAESDKPVTMADTPRDSILVERESAWGNATETHYRIAKGWSAILNHEVTAQEVALCMTVQKAVRAAISPDLLDSYEDGRGYWGIAAETVGLGDQLWRK